MAQTKESPILRQGVVAMRGEKGINRRRILRGLAGGGSVLAVAPVLTLGLRPALAGADINVAQFNAWVQAVREEAAARGVSVATLDDAFKGVSFNYDVIALDQKQPESTMTFADYLARIVNDKRVATGRDLFRQNRALLERIGHLYGVQPRFIVALWGMESNYGGQQGDYRIVEALATLAYEGRRADFFRKELLNALEILEHHDVSAGNMLGSWAGAMGQCQFMPSSYLRFAVDADGDGKRDIWNSTADVFGSIANYLAHNDWNVGQTWGREVKLPAHLDSNLISLDIEKPLEEWEKLGLRLTDGSNLPVVHKLYASLVRPDESTGPAYLVYGNYKAIMKWNRSTYFATAVGTLADRLEPV
jgi:membrane-bound lytic murein transglycosylase B